MAKTKKRPVVITAIIAIAATLLARQFLHSIKHHTLIMEPDELTTLRTGLADIGFNLTGASSGLVLASYRFTGIGYADENLLICTSDALGSVGETAVRLDEESYDGVHLRFGTPNSPDLENMDCDGLWYELFGHREVKVARLRRGESSVLVVEVIN